ncbi:MAG: DUF6339 family protein [Mediterraneibacter gnavus]
MTSLIIFDTGIEVDDYQLISGGPETDFSNAKILYEALQGHINLVQASDLRLWAYMAHKQHWDYMHTRWGIDLPDDEDEAEENETKNLRQTKRSIVLEHVIFQGIERKSLCSSGYSTIILECLFNL